MMDQHTGFPLSGYHGHLVVEFYQLTQNPLHPLSKPNQDLEMVFNKWSSLHQQNFCESSIDFNSPMK